jgi:hypothetical protein
LVRLEGAGQQLSLSKISLDNWVRVAREGKLAEVGKGQRLPSELELELARTGKELADVSPLDDWSGRWTKVRLWPGTA